ncbi:hypothetical protein ACRALDRAFT_1059542 [Sodiomyces alcalophilus JCM 7366]|uniref:uncharacterized protein n=1 Tax=Sodiomyces alcalophilus JCM 7366 TaxID=591952 RepID=UPI0039B4D962
MPFYHMGNYVVPHCLGTVVPVDGGNIDACLGQGSLHRNPWPCPYFNYVVLRIVIVL